MKYGIAFLILLIVGIGMFVYQSAIFSDSKEEGNTETESAEDTSERETEDVEELQVYSYETAEIWCENEGQKIYGIAYIPESVDKVPLVIFAHELGNTLAGGTEYAKIFASHGIAVYTFDFRGGGNGSRSDGLTTEMSVMTEASDLEAVLAVAKSWDFVDAEKIVLMGASQGGMVSAVTAARIPDELAGMILLYPAFVIHDAVHSWFPTLELVPEQYDLRGWILVGKVYAQDVWDYDIYEEMGQFSGPVLILHGNRDDIVDVLYSERAVECYPNARMYVIDGAGHGFYEEDFDLAVEYILGYLQEVVG